jgi:hypothetical protein
MLNIVFLAIGIISVGLSLRILAIKFRTKKSDITDIMSKSSGIFIEHGMVRAKGRVGVEADKKISDTYFSSVI